MFSGVSLSDRLKAAVTQLEATGSQLQAKAIAATSMPATTSTTPGGGGPPGGPSRPITPNVAKDGEKGGAESASTAHLAESALSGLRRSFNVARASFDGSRPGSTEPGPSSPIKVAEPAPGAHASAGTTSPDKVAIADATEAKSKQTDAINGSERDLPESKVDSPTSAPSAPVLSEPEPSIAADPSDPADSAAPAANIEEPTSKSKKKKKKKGKKGKAEKVEEKDEEEEKEAEVGPEKEAEDVEPVEEVALEQTKPDAEPPAGTAKELENDLPAVTAPQPSKEDGKPSTEAIANISKPDAVSTKATSAIDIPKASIEAISPPPLVSPSKEDDPSKRLSDVERRFEQLSKRYTELLSQTHSANKIIRELTPLEGGVADIDALEGWIRMVNGKMEMITGEIARMQGNVDLQKSRMEELRDTHRLESKSQSDLIAKLRSQLSTAESNLSNKAGDMVQVAQLKADLAKAQTQAKEEEEKRTKAISLLKTVRQKLVKVEKEKEEIERDRAEERMQRSKAFEEVEKAKAEREREVNNLRKGFEREIASLKERSEKELAARKGAWELEMITTKASHAKELTNKASKITGLEATVKELHATAATQFDTIQARQSEAESARSEMEVLQNRTKELEFQLRETTERLALLEDAPRSTSAPEASPIRESGTSAAEVARLLADAESRAEQRVQDMRARVRTLERERNELEEDWASKLAQRVKELETLRQTLSDKEAEVASAAASRRDRDARIDSQDAEKRELERQMVELRAAVDEAHAEVSVAAEAERAAREELSSAQSATASVQTQLDEAKALQAQLRQNNKTLRDELRKVQSSVQLMERQRNPGVGYWAGQQGSQPTPPVQSASASPAPPAQVPSPAPSNDEEVNLEYLRNVILQFLEHREMRPNLVRVLSVILRFTPQELRRLEAKMLS